MVPDDKPDKPYTPKPFLGVPDTSAQDYDYAGTYHDIKLTPKVINVFCRMLERGYTITSIIDFVGTSDSAFQTWKSKGELVESGAADIPNGELYKRFVKGMKRAVAIWQMQRIDRAHTDRTWQRELALLKIRDPDNFGDHKPGDQQTYNADDTFL